MHLQRKDPHAQRAHSCVGSTVPWSPPDAAAEGRSCALQADGPPLGQAAKSALKGQH